MVALNEKPTNRLFITNAVFTIYPTLYFKIGSKYAQNRIIIFKSSSKLVFPFKYTYIYAIIQHKNAELC
jgi:hypothetical protein